MPIDSDWYDFERVRLDKCNFYNHRYKDNTNVIKCQSPVTDLYAQKQMTFLPGTYEYSNRTIYAEMDQTKEGVDK